MKQQFKSINGRIVELTEERKKHIFEFHPELELYFAKVAETLKNPDEIRKSKHDREVLLFYKYFSKIKSGKYLVVVVKINQRNFILTCYLTDKALTGQTKNI